jgi:8-oxo-dGTP diphosphatase
MRTRLIVKAVVVADGRVLLGKSKKLGKYELPGGKVNDGESLLDALVREVLEEIGIVVEPDAQPVLVSERVFNDELGVAMVYRCSLVDLKPMQVGDGSLTHVCFFTPDAMRHMAKNDTMLGLCAETLHKLGYM